MKGEYFIGIAIGIIIGIGGTIQLIDNKIAKYEKSLQEQTALQQREVEERTVRAYKYGYMDGSNAVLSLQSTKTLSIEAFQDRQTLDSLRFFNEWNGEKL